MNESEKYENVAQFLKGEKFVHGLTKYENLLMKSKVYFRIPDTQSKFDEGYYSNSSVRYSGFTWFGRIIVSLILVVCVLGLALIGVFTGNIKYIFNWSAYREYDLIDDIIDEFFDGEPFSRNINSRFDGYDNIPTVLKTDKEARAFLKYKYKYKNKKFVFNSDEYNLQKYGSGTTILALLKIGKLDPYWNKMRLNLTEKENKKQEE